MVSDADRILRDMTPAPALTDEEASLEASIRLKLEMGQRLDPDERAFLARLYADKEAGPEVIQKRLRKA